MSLRATLEPKSNVLGKGIFKNEFLELIPQVMREELNSKVRIRRGVQTYTGVAKLGS